jgi:4'-phosphopantetheinyl transferase
MTAIEHLFQDEVHLWRKRLHGHTSLIEDANLSSEERARARSFKNTNDGRRFAEGRLFLRRVLGSYLDVAARDVRLTSSPGKKPRLGRGGPEFNLSRANDVCVVVVGHGPVGVDVEAVPDAVDPDLALRVFGGTGRSKGRTTTDFARAWTRLEATAKASGAGLARTWDAASPGTRVAGPWTYHDLAVPRGYVATAAVSARELRVVEKGR